MIQDDLSTVTAEIVGAYVSRNSVTVGDIAGLIRCVHEALAAIREPVITAAQPAVSVRASIRPDYLVCLEDGKRMTMLKRYLSRVYGLTPDQYRAKWKLPADYPMTCPDYAARRRNIALSIGLGARKGNRSRMKNRQPVRSTPLSRARH